MDLRDFIVRPAVDTTAAGTTSVTGSTIDTASSETLTFLVKLGTAAANNTIKVQHGSLANMSDASDVLGSSVSVGSSDKLLAVTLVKPVKRYARVVVVRGTSTTVDAGVVVLGGLRFMPADNTVDGVIASEVLISPESGVA